MRVADDIKQPLLQRLGLTLSHTYVGKFAYAKRPYERYSHKSLLINSIYLRSHLHPSRVNSSGTSPSIKINENGTHQRQ